MNFYHLDDIPEDLRGYFEPAPQLGLENTPQEYVEKMIEVFREVRRVLKDDGTLWLNLGDSYSRAPEKGGSGPGAKNESKWGYGSAQSAKTGSSDGKVGRSDRPGTRAKSKDLKPKDLVGIPWRVAFALQADGWYLRQDIIWHKPNPMPESVTDRCTKAHEYIFLMSKQARYYYDADAINEKAVAGCNGSTFTEGKTALNGDRKGLGMGPRNDACTRNKRSVWTVPSSPYSEAHFATFPPDLIKPCILAGSKHGDIVLDPFGGSGTTGQVAISLGRKSVLIELNPEYCELIKRRTDTTPGLALI